MPSERPTRQLLMVCVSADRSQEKLVREGARLAQRLQAKWIVVHVDQPYHGDDTRARETLPNIVAFAQAAGAEFANVPGQDVVETLLDYARICSRIMNCRKFGAEEYSDLLAMNDAAITVAVDAAAAKDFNGSSVPQEWIDGRKAATVQFIRAAQKLLEELKVKQVSRTRAGRVCQASARFDPEALKTIALDWAIIAVRKRDRSTTWTQAVAAAGPIAESYARCLSTHNDFTIQNAVVTLPANLYLKGCN